MQRVLCVVFAKPPVPGQTKSRLASTLGPDAAATLAGAFLRDTVAGLARIPGLAVVVSTPEPTADHGVGVPRWDQGGGELGARLERAFRRALLTFDGAIALGADSPGLPSTHLVALRDAASGSAVIGRTDDGGFWGLGLPRCPEGLLLGLPWSTTATATATVERLASRGFVVSEAPGWWDIDVEADLLRFRRDVARAEAPETHAALDRLRWA